MRAAGELNRDRPRKIRARQRGVSSIEYALVGVLVAVAIVSSVAVVGTNLEASYSSTAGSVIAALKGS